MEHLWQKLDSRRFVRIFFAEFHLKNDINYYYLKMWGKWGKTFTISLKVPSSNGVSWGPNITAFHTIMLFSPGAPLTPSGGSSWSLLKSLIKRRLAAVDILSFLKIRVQLVEMSFTIFVSEFAFLLTLLLRQHQCQCHFWSVKCNQLQNDWQVFQSLTTQPWLKN